MSSKRVIEVSRGELGYTESPPGSNETKYGKAYAWDGIPWCAVFLWWCFREAGESAAFYGGAKTASCGTLLRWYREQGQVVPAAEVQPGDIVILNFSGTKDTEHCGLVVDVATYSTSKLSSLVTVEGNTSPGFEGSQDNGGCVAMKRRYPSQIVAVCRPQYTADPPRPDYAGHWAEEAIRWAMDKGLMTGYADGSFRPDAALTRGELATVLKRLEEAK